MVELGGQIKGSGVEVPQWGSGAKPRQEVWGQSHSEAEAFLKVHNLKFKAM